MVVSLMDPPAGFMGSGTVPIINPGPIDVRIRWTSAFMFPRSRMVPPKASGPPWKPTRKRLAGKRGFAAGGDRGAKVTGVPPVRPAPPEAWNDPAPFTPVTTVL